MDWTFNGDSLATLRAAGLISARLTYRSRAPDELVLEFGGLAETPLDGWSLHSDVVVVADETTVFKGRVIEQPRQAGSSEVRRVVAQGPWWWLANTVYQQEYRLSVVDDYRKRPGYRLFCDRDGNRITAAAQIEDVFTYVASIGGDLALGTNPTGPKPAPQQAANLTCAEAIERALRWTPDACTWWDYSASPPTMNVMPWTVAVSSVTTIAMTDPTLRAVEAVPRRDLLIPGVRLLFENVANASSVAPYPVEQVAPAGFDGLQPQGINLVIDLRGQTGVPDALAQRYYDAFKVLQYSGRLVVQASEPDMSWHPGDAVRISGGLSEWSTMRAQVQSVSHDLLDGSTSLEFGPPDHLGLNDLVELLLADSREGPAYYLASGRPVTSSTPTGEPLMPYKADTGIGTVSWSAEVRFLPGLVNALTPVIDGTSIATSPGPTIHITGNGSLYLKVTWSGSAAIAAELVFLTSAPTSTPTIGYQQRALITGWNPSNQAYTITPLTKGSVAVARLFGTWMWGLA